MSKIYFSLGEANEMIRKISPRLERIIILKDELDLLDNTKLEFDEEKVENYLLEIELNKSFHEKNLELYKIIENLIREGCVVRNIDEMEIDFYSKLEDKDITFCWNPGHEKILYWHFPQEEKKMRRPIKQIESNYFETLKRHR
ncbi:MAG: DUF2203 family protein [Candidatus ainarchaeum sp.]|nr:DUF2203 family protein [Candidatus ainarchaeum sp.]